MIMKKVLLMMTGLVMAGTAWADWSDQMGNPTPIFPAGTGSYAIEVAVGDDGDIWAVNYHPNLKDADDEYDIEHVVYEYRLQHFDKNGNPLFPEDGILISDYANKSYTVVSNYIHVDSEGNCIVAVSDQRNASDIECSVTAYKVSPTGEQLWGEDGVAVSDALHPADFVACMRLVEMDDHSIVTGKEPVTYACSAYPKTARRSGGLRKYGMRARPAPIPIWCLQKTIPAFLCMPARNPRFSTP